MINVIVGAANFVPKDNETYYLFDPREETLTAPAPNIFIYPHALGIKNEIKDFYITKKPSCSSFLEPNIELIKTYTGSYKRFEVEHTIPTFVLRGDEIFSSGITINYLQIDTQGSELDILIGFGQVLKNVKKITCEVEFVSLYKNQPLYGEVKAYLKSYGFKQTDINTKYWNQDKIFADVTFINNAE